MIVIGEDTPILRTVCEPVTVEVGVEVGAALRKEIKDGLGLAAPQIGRNARVFILRGWPDPFINPEILDLGREYAAAEEGCLSLPGIRRVVQRPKTIKLRAQRPSGEWRVFKLRKLDARAAQHELDHLDGVLIVDY